jgi:hypothetical protein
MLKLSKTSKLDNIKSWSLQALTTCPGSIAKDGGLVDACKGCYATQGFYNFSQPKAVRADNKQDWQRDEWVTDMVAALKKESYFRWFDSGDMYSVKLAEKMYAVMVATPHVKHWLPTRMYKFEKFAPILAKMQALPNVMVRFSSDSVIGQYTKGLHGSTILPSQDTPEGVFRCNAYNNGGKCSGCRACYSKDIPVIGYVQHGRAMKKVVALKLAA